MKKSGKKKGKVVGGVGVVAVLAAALLFAGKGLGFGFGDGSGTGEGNGADTEITQPADENKEVTETPKEDVGIETVTIEVKQGQYFIDGAEKTLEDIEALLMAEDVADTSFVLTDNYASTKAWDELKALFTEYEVDAVEQ